MAAHDAAFRFSEVRNYASASNRASLPIDREDEAPSP
jgi:hypothetical protein